MPEFKDEVGDEEDLETKPTKPKPMVVFRPYLTEQEKFELSNFKSLLDNLKESVKDLTNNIKTREISDTDNKTKVANIDLKLSYIQSELTSNRDYFEKINGKLENLTGKISEYRQDISLMKDQMQSLDKQLEEMKERKKEVTANTIAIIAIVASIIAAVITGIIDKLH